MLIVSTYNHPCTDTDLMPQPRHMPVMRTTTPDPSAPPHLLSLLSQHLGALQIALFGVAVWQFKTGASSGDRLRILPIFFLGSAEMASGLTGL